MSVTDNVSTQVPPQKLLLYMDKLLGGGAYSCLKGGGAYSCHNAVIGQSSRCPNMPKHAQTCQSPPDVYSVAVMTQSFMSQP